MLRIVLPLSLLSLCLGGCGSKAGPTKAALQQLFDRVNADDGPGAAKLIVYRGSDEARRWKAISGYTSDEDKARVTAVMQNVKYLLNKGSPEFVSFETETESEGEWLVWKMKFGDQEAAVACLDIDGTIAVGDID